jgi:hypothetical protein
MYRREEFEVLLRKAGFTGIQVTRAYEDLSDIAENDGMLFACQKSNNHE